MAKTMIASGKDRKPMSGGQIENVVSKLRDALRKHKDEFGLDEAQVVLGRENIGMELLAPFRDLVEAESNLITRRVRVNRTYTSQQAIDATGRVKYTDDKSVATMPTVGPDEVEVIFAKAGRYLKSSEVPAFLASHGLTPDPLAQVAVNEKDPSFADEYPNGTQWQDDKGVYHFLAFSRWRGERNVNCDRRDYGWDDCWWFGGVRKPAQKGG